MNKRIFTMFFLVFTCTYSYSIGQDKTSSTLSPEKDTAHAKALKLRDLALKKLEQSAGSKVEVEFAENGTPTRLSGKLSEKAYPDKLHFALHFLDIYKNLFLLLNPREELTVKETGVSGIYFEQTYEGLPVFRTKLIVHFYEGYINAVIGELTPSPKIKLSQFKIIPEDALKAANKEFKTKRSLDETDFRLGILPFKNQNFLAWKIYIHDKDSNPWDCFVDAVKGSFLTKDKMWAEVNYEY